MAEENVYRVMLVLHGENAVHGFFVYRGTELPEPNQAIEVESELSSSDRRRARVSRIVEGDDSPVRAVELAP